MADIIQAAFGRFHISIVILADLILRECGSQSRKRPAIYRLDDIEAFHSLPGIIHCKNISLPNKASWASITGRKSYAEYWEPCRRRLPIRLVYRRLIFDVWRWPFIAAHRATPLFHHNRNEQRARYQWQDRIVSFNFSAFSLYELLVFYIIFRLIGEAHQRIDGHTPWPVLVTILWNFRVYRVARIKWNPSRKF